MPEEEMGKLLLEILPVARLIPNLNTFNTSEEFQWGISFKHENFRALEQLTLGLKQQKLDILF